MKLSLSLLLAFAFTSLPQLDAADLMHEVEAAREAALADLSAAERDHAEKLSGGIPTLSLGVGPSPLKTGAWGRLERVETYGRPQPAGNRALDARTATGQQALRANITTTIRDAYFDVNEVVDARNMLVDDFEIWIEGVDTSDLIDESSVNLAAYVFEVKGTKRYATAIGGARTVKHLVVIGSSPDVRTAAAKLRELAEFREWKDETGKHSILARYVGFKDGKVQLEKLDGKVGAVAITSLGDDEQKFVRDLVKAAKPAKPNR